MGTWESDLSAILSAAAPVAAPAPAMAAPTAAGGWPDGGGNPAEFLGDLGGAAGGDGGARDGRRRGGAYVLPVVVSCFQLLSLQLDDMYTPSEWLTMIGSLGELELASVHSLMQSLISRL